MTASDALIRNIGTGVPGLDAVLGGGLCEYSFNLIAGAPEITYVTPVGAKIDPSVAMPRSIADA